jgi:broad specificity phosphatase PhoE
MTHSPFAPAIGAVIVTVVLAVGTAGCAASVDETVNTTDDNDVSIYLTRHGETWFNKLELAQGWSDSPLTADGEQDAVADGKGFTSKDITFDAAYSADMVRHFDTATLILQEMGSALIPQRDEGLREMAFGKFEGTPAATAYAEIAEAGGYPSADAMLTDVAGSGQTAMLNAVAKANNGSEYLAEAPEDVQQRAMDTLTTIAEDQANVGGGEVLVVSSGFTIGLILSHLADDPALNAPIMNGAVSVLTYTDGERKIDTINDTSYLEAGGRP